MTGWISLGLVVLATSMATAPAQAGGLLTPSRVPGVEELRLLQDGSRGWQQNGEEASGGTNPRVKAMLLSALLPGLGQYVAGDRSWSYGFFIAEAAIWASHIGFRAQGGEQEDRFERFASVWAGVEQPAGHSSTYYSDLGSFPTYEDYRVVAIRTGEGDLYPDEQHWAWPSEERRERYLDLRAESESSFQRAEFMIAAALLNRAVSVVHAARSVSASPPAVRFGVMPDADTGELLPTVSWQTRF